ncbi:single-stranded DNA-binding protein [Paracoccus suum]|uniref:Single-stranded DNA-binding protein n=1 Tax=Paracoccus suum TaxID=2259340 RepID=A0A344PKX5_9RHOB|nr:single-stranded DNA-binding protein [Paracoccus suum]AXC50030.1 single-stranded DNA-binding protein [Paracoccus suum]
MKTITVAGNIGKDAVTRTTQGGDKVTSWTVAVEERAGQEKRTIWFDCSLWGKRGEALAQYLTKGGRVAVSGDLSTREHEGRTYLTVRADQVTLLGGSQQTGGARASGAPAGGAPSNAPTFDDDIPFAPCVML